ncbi:MAG: hypothetical protein HWE26_17545 [Alteromonadaceae bacterium]|nr:hypothetical protein [Alteromonadaceae bacterium]
MNSITPPDTTIAKQSIGTHAPTKNRDRADTQASPSLPDDAPKNYASSPAQSQVDDFLEAFARQSSVYSLINELNTNLKSLIRDLQQTEAQERIHKYVSQLDTVVEKYHHSLEVAKDIKNLKDLAAEQTKKQGIANIAFSPLSFFAPALSKGTVDLLEHKAQLLNNEAEKVRMDHDAINTLLDGVASFTEKEGQLANTQINALDSLYQSFSSLVDGLHQSNQSAFEAIARTMV